MKVKMKKDNVTKLVIKVSDNEQYTYQDILYIEELIK